MRSWLDNDLGVLLRQHQRPHDKPNIRGIKAEKNRRDLWFSILSRSNYISGGINGGTSCPSCLKGVMESYW